LSRALRSEHSGSQCHGGAAAGSAQLPTLHDLAFRLPTSVFHLDRRSPFSRSGLFWKLLLAFSAVGVAAILLVAWLFSNAYATLLEREVAHRISAAATLAAD